MRRRQVFSREFKLEAIRLLEEGKKPAADIARELGIRRNQLYKWKEQRDKRKVGLGSDHDNYLICKAKVMNYSAYLGLRMLFWG